MQILQTVEETTSLAKASWPKLNHMWLHNWIFPRFPRCYCTLCNAQLTYAVEMDISRVKYWDILGLQSTQNSGIRWFTFWSTIDTELFWKTAWNGKVWFSMLISSIWQKLMATKTNILSLWRNFATRHIVNKNPPTKTLWRRLLPVDCCANVSLFYLSVSTFLFSAQGCFKFNRRRLLDPKTRPDIIINDLKCFFG